MLWLWIAIGGALGSTTRYTVERYVETILGYPSPLGVFLINTTGSFLLGVFVSATQNHTTWPIEIRLLVTIGFLGSYTTFSTLTVATMQSAMIPDLPKALLNILGSFAIGLIAATLGILAGRTI